jgi:hypothetical protein
VCVCKSLVFHPSITWLGLFGLACFRGREVFLVIIRKNMVKLFFVFLA